MRALDARAARAWALRALARRMRSAHEVREGLRRRGYPESAVVPVMASLAAAGLVDDEAFAARWVAVRSETKCLGPSRLALELRMRGVGQEAIRAAIAAVLDVEAEARLARLAAARKMRTSKGSGPRAVAALLRHLRSRGFSAEAIRKALSGLPEDPS